jgi:hypothetical protein
MANDRTKELAADEFVAAVHPYGEWNGQHSTSAAWQVAELVRYLNHATLDHPDQAVPDPNTAAAILGALHTAATRLPQLLDQLAGRMRAFAADPDLATSSADGAQTLAGRSAAFLTAARPVLSQLTAALGNAHQAADRLYLDSEDDE